MDPGREVMVETPSRNRGRIPASETDRFDDAVAPAIGKLDSGLLRVLYLSTTLSFQMSVHIKKEDHPHTPLYPEYITIESSWLGPTFIWHADVLRVH